MGYGYRWIVETVFSSIKRTFGEHVTARKFHNMVKEIYVKASLRLYPSVSIYKVIINVNSLEIVVEECWR
jgi:hypothetical protein